MKKLAALLLSLFFTLGTALADTPDDQDAKAAAAAPAAKPKAVAKKAPAGPSNAALASQLEELKQAIAAQQSQIQLLKDELARRDQAIGDVRSAAAAADSKAVEAAGKASNAAATAAEAKTAAATVGSDVSDLKLSSESLKSAVQDTQKKIIAAESPATIHYKGINITPGGFVAAETVFRNRATSGDINTPFTGIPYPNNALSKFTENNFTARQTRATVLLESKVGTAKVTGYYEGDFLGAGTTSNNRQSNSYVFRQRQVWANVTWDNGASVAAGQMWSLVTESQKGIANRREAFPMQIDPQYVVGWAWQRAYAFRVAKDFGKFALAAAVEGPQTTIGGRGYNANFVTDALGAGGGLYNQFDATGYSLNRAPDFLVKATLDPGWGHYELVGILSNFRNRIYPCGALALTANLPAACGTPPVTTSVAGAHNDSKVGGGIGLTGRFPLIAKKLDFALHFQGGDGVGRYSSAQLSDVTAKPDGSLEPIRSAAWLGTLEAHPNPKLDLYAYYGGEYAARTAYVFTNAAGHPVGVGYGSPLFNNSACGVEVSPSTGGPAGSGFPNAGGGCAGDIHQILEGTLGFWHKFYNSPKGRLQWGLQYSYITKYGWSGNNTSSTTGAAGPSLRPHAVDNMFFTSFRYYLP